MYLNFFSKGFSKGEFKMILFIIIIFLSGIIGGIIAKILTKNKKKNIPLFCNTNYIYGKFTDQYEVSIDDVVKKDFKLLDI